MNNNGDDDKDLELLHHWIKELDGFEARISRLLTRTSIFAFLDDPRPFEGQSISLSALVGGSSRAILVEEFDGLAWMDNKGDTGFSSGMYIRLLDLSDHLRSMDKKIKAVMKGHDALFCSSLWLLRLRSEGGRSIWSLAPVKRHGYSWQLNARFLDLFVPCAEPQRVTAANPIEPTKRTCPHGIG